MNAAEETRKNFIWAIKAGRLCDYVIQTHIDPGCPYIETTKVDAEKLIAIAKDYTEKWIKDSLNEGDITKRQANIAYKELTKLINNAEKIKEKL